jgi:adenylate cyclase
MPRLRGGTLRGLLIGLVVALAAAVLRGQDPGIVSATRANGFDTLQRLYPRAAVDLPVRFVEIDEASLEKVGQWPWPRDRLARLVDRLAKLGAAVVVFDIIFPEPDRLSPSRIAGDKEFMASLGVAARSEVLSSLPDNDRIFATAIGGTRVVLAFSNAPGSKRRTPVRKAGIAVTGDPVAGAPPRLAAIAGNIPELEAAAAGIGAINIDLASEQGVARQIPLLWTDGENLYPSLVVEALRIAQGADTIIVNGSERLENAIESVRVGDIEIPVSENSLFALHYRAAGSGEGIPAWRLLSDKDNGDIANRVKGSIIFIGASAAGLLDIRTTALGESVPGVTIHAQATEQILVGDFLSRPEWAAGAEIATTLLLAVAIIGLTMLSPPVSAASATLTAIFMVIGLAIYAFRFLGLLVDATFPTVALVLVFLATLAFRLLVADRDRRMLRGAFGHFVAPEILAKIERDPAALNLGGEVRDVSVMFVDIRNFTHMSEVLPPEALVSLVNRLLGECSDRIIAAGGTIDKYIGDAIMAFWNAPVATPDHQWRAARAALDVRDTVRRLNEDAGMMALLKPVGLWPLRVGIGISTGPACVGNMGSAERFDYSVVGETVNVASRAETATKDVGADIVIAGTIEGRTAGLALLDAGRVRMKGRAAPTPVTLVAGDERAAASNLFSGLRDINRKIAEALLKGKRREAKGLAKAGAAQASEAGLALESYFAMMPARQADFGGATTRTDRTPH